MIKRLPALFLVFTLLGPAVAQAAPASGAAIKTGAKMKSSTAYHSTPSGLQYQDLKIGSGPLPKTGQTVIVNYTGTFPNGKKFDSSRDRSEPFSFQIGLSKVIAGWDEGVATMRKGGRRKLIVPAKLAYGDAGAGGVIPPGATLLFDIELLDIK